MDLTGAQSALNDALLQYQAHVGAFMQTGAEAQSLRDRAQAFTSSEDPAVAAKAQAAVQEANAALSDFNNIESSALQAANQASSLKSQIDHDPQWQNLMNADLSSLGWATLDAITSKVKQISDVTAALASVEARIEKHLDDTMPQLRSDVDDVNNLAQGKGISGVAHSLVSTYTGAVSGVVDKLASSLGLGETGKWVGIAAVVLILGPIAVDSLVAAFVPRPHRNPPRRRRRRYSRRRR